MIPALAIPVINRPDALERCVASIDHPVEHLVIVDNSRDGDMADGLEIPSAVERMTVTVMPANLGYPGSVNLVIKTLAWLPWWCIANGDVVLGPGDLGRLDEEMSQGGARWVGINDWRVFGLSAEAVDAVGFWDENFSPAYCEDADYEWRCRLAGVPAYAIDGTTSHEGSIAIRSDPAYGQANARSYPANRRYFIEKWGGELRGFEAHTTPFDRGGHLGDWRLDRSRLAGQAWR